MKCTRPSCSCEVESTNRYHKDGKWYCSEICAPVSAPTSGAPASPANTRYSKEAPNETY